MNGYSVIDDKGNIDRARLSKELQDALESDIRYRQTDNMKKRAVKVAGDYKEFKEMVAAAHLKKLTKSEVESLSHVKKGWQKTVVKDKTSTPFLLGKELEEEKIRKQNEEVKLTNPGKVAASFANGELKSTTAKVKKPKSAMELERDLRRCSNDTERIM